jgi:hypothetical protein
MTNETFETVELGQAEALIELIGVMSEELEDKLDPVVAPYVEFE